MDEKRAELAAQRKLLDEYIQQAQQQPQPQKLPQTSAENNHSNGFTSAAASAGDVAELEAKLRDAVGWAQKAEAKVAGLESYWADQKLRWQRERADLQDRIREIVLERVSLVLVDGRHYLDISTELL